MSDSLVLRLALLLVVGVAPALSSTIQLTVRTNGLHPDTGPTGEQRIDLETTTASSLVADITQLGPITFGPSAQPTASYRPGEFKLSGIEAACPQGELSRCTLSVSAQFFLDSPLEGAAVMQMSGSVTNAFSVLGDIAIYSDLSTNHTYHQAMAITQMPWPDGPFTFSQSIAYTMTDTVRLNLLFLFEPGGTISIPGSITFSFPALQIPEPGSGALVLLGFALLALRARRRASGYDDGRNG